MFQYCDLILEVTLLLLFFLIIHLRKIFHKNHRHIAFAEKLPGPRFWPLIGNSLDFWYGGTEGVSRLATYCKEYGSIYRLWFGRHLFVVISDADKLKTIFHKTITLDKPDLFLTSFREFQGDGLSSCPMNIWKKTRRNVQPLFGKKELKFYIPEMNRILGNFVRTMEILAGDHEFDVYERLLDTTFNIIIKSNFDIEFNSHDTSALRIRSCNKIFSEVCFLRMFRSWLHIPLIYNLRYYRLQRRVKRDIRSFTRMVLERKLPQLKLEQLNDTDVLKPGISSMPFLSTLYKIQDDTLSENWLHDQIAFLIIAGPDGVAVMMSFFLLSVAMYPKVQEKLHDELDKVFGNDDRQATYEDIEQLAYLDQVLKETERKYTFLPFIFRNVEEDCKIGEYNFPAGTSILINIHQIHYNEKYYPDPHKFNPDNFSPEAVHQRPSLSFLPFSHGPRNCIAEHYATLVMKITLVALLRKFNFYTSMCEDNIRVNVGFITTSVNGYKLRIKLRNHIN